MILLTIQLALAIIAASPQDTPTKAETKLYTKAMTKPSVKACEKFLSSFPASAYAKQIEETRDSLVFFSEVSTDDAASLETFVARYPKSKYSQKAEEMLVNSYKAEISFNCQENSINDSHTQSLNIKIHELKHGEWAIKCEKELPKYTFYDNVNCSSIIDKPRIVMIHDRCMIYFSYLNWEKNGKHMEYVTNLISPNGENYTNSLFYGNNLAQTGKTQDKDSDSTAEGFRIEGRSPEELAQGGLSHEQAFLWEKMLKNERLVRISKEDEMSDDAIQWWLENNPKAMTSANVAKFGILPAECSLVGQYKKASKESSRSFSAAIIDFRGYTMVIAYAKASKQYSLIWAEPMAQDKYRDRYLNNIYFDSAGTTLNMFYYQGKKTFKLYINLASKAIKR